MYREDSVQSTSRRVLINAGALTGSSIWRIILSFILQLVIARRLGFDALGHYIVALTYLNISQVLTELGFQTLLVRDLAQHLHLRKVYFRNTIQLQLGASLLVGLALYCLSLLYPFALTIKYSLWLVALSLPLYALTVASVTIFQACERMELVMIVEVVSNTLIMVGSLILLWFNYTILWLIGIWVVVQLIAAWLCLLLLYRYRLLQSFDPRTNHLEPGQKVVGSSTSSSRKNALSKTFSDKRLVDTKARVRLNPLSAKSLLRKAWPFYAVALTEVLLQRVDVLVLSLLGNPTLTGIYGAAYSVVRVLLKLIQSYWKALYPTISRLRLEAEEQYQQIRLHGLRYGSILILLCAALGAGGAEGLLGLVYRTEIDSALLVFRILIWTAPIFLIETYCVLFLMVEQRPTDSLFLTMLHVAVVLVLLPLLSSFAGAVGIAWTMIIAGLAGTAMGLG
ncbi:oligosaccharide flippase family protein [Chloroflexi bacterium TSY]|nr:oligosaccharide flippase family protein [Chloroflexi bacterium TSY]